MPSCSLLGSSLRGSVPSNTGPTVNLDLRLFFAHSVLLLTMAQNWEPACFLLVNAFEKF